jgi:hypothetical protein
MWARAHLKLGDVAGPDMVAQAAPTYPWSRGAPIRPRKQAPGTRPESIDDGPLTEELQHEDEVAAPSSAPAPTSASAPKAAKRSRKSKIPKPQAAPAPAPRSAEPEVPQDADDFDPLAGAHDAPERSAPKPQDVWQDEPRPSRSRPAVDAAPPPEPASKPETDSIAAPEKPAPKPADVPPIMNQLPVEKPATAAAKAKPANLQTSPGAKKSVTDMSVDELEKYLNRK